MIEGKGIRAGYGEKEVLHGVDFVFPAGQVTAIIGPNGCGKSTLLKTVAGLLSCKGGSLTAEGIDLTACSAGQRAQTVSYLPQNRQTPELTVGTLVLHGRFSRLRYPRRYGEEDRQAAQKAMEWAGIAHLKEERLPRLSGGMQQKAYLAMALCQDAKVLLLDEPTTFLDISQQLRLMQTAKELALAPEGKYVFKVPETNNATNSKNKEDLEDEETSTTGKGLHMIGFNLGPNLALTEQGIKAQITSGEISQRVPGSVPPSWLFVVC